ncbi:MAG: hypothetical protein R6U65_02620 [Perlabentimonas sp.]
MHLILLSSLAKGQAVQVDVTGSIWLIKENSVNRIDHNGNLLGSYKNLLLGKPKSLDASDPFRILVFYKESQNILLLNNDANIIGQPVNLNELGLGEIILACRSTRGGVWLYHRVSAEFVRLDQRLVSVVQQIPFSSIDNKSHPNHIVQEDGVLFAGINNEMIYRIDEYGTILPTLEIPYKDAFRIHNNKLWVLHNNQTIGYNLKKPEANPVKYDCPCQALGVIIDNNLMCFDGKTFQFCKKINPLP